MTSWQELAGFFHPALEESKQKYWAKSNSPVVKKFLKKMDKGVLNEEDYSALHVYLRNRLDVMEEKKNKNSDKMADSLEKFERATMDNINDIPSEDEQSDLSGESDLDDEEDLDQIVRKRKKGFSHDDNKKKKSKSINQSAGKNSFFDEQSLHESGSKDDPDDDEDLLNKAKKLSYTKKSGLKKVSKTVREAVIDIFEDEMTEGILKPENIIRVPISFNKAWKIAPITDGSRSGFNLSQRWYTNGKKSTESNIPLGVTELPKVIKTFIYTSMFFLGKIPADPDDLQTICNSPTVLRGKLEETMKFLGLEGNESEEMFLSLLHFIDIFIKKSKTSVVEVVEEPEVGIAQQHFNSTNHWKEEKQRKKAEEDEKIKKGVKEKKKL